jgi:uncharacterized protein
VAQRLLIVIVLLAVVSCARDGTPSVACDVPPSVAFAGGSARLTVEVARDDAARARGLMGVAELPADHGMAFVWEGPTRGSFWMKDTLIPLSIAFVDEGGAIVTIEEMTPCESDPCPTYEASAPYSMAVEANAGWFAEHEIEVGDDARLREPACP